MTIMDKNLTISFNAWDEKFTVNVVRSTYCNNDNLAVMAIDAKTGEPFGNFTVNTDYKLPADHAAVDVNNMAFVVHVLEETGIATLTDVTIPSGFVKYPVMKFDLTKIPTI